MATIEFIKDGARLYLSDHIGKPMGGPHAQVLGAIDYDLSDFRDEFGSGSSYRVTPRLQRFLDFFFGTLARTRYRQSPDRVRRRIVSILRGSVSNKT